MSTGRTIGIVGGTGPHGRGLALRLRDAGHHVLLGSRDPARALEAAARLPAAAGTAGTAGTGAVEGVTNARAASADVVLVTTPSDALDAVAAAHAAAFSGRVVVSCANPLRPDGGVLVPAPPAEGSAAQLLQDRCPDARVVAAFQNLSAVRLGDADAVLDEDVLVCGDDDGAVDVVMALVDSIAGLRALRAGPLRLAGVVEGITALLIGINRRYRATSGVRITDVDAAGDGSAS